MAVLTTGQQGGVVYASEQPDINAWLQCRPNDRHTSLALYILLRGATLLIRCGNKPDAAPTVRKVLAPTRWKHGDTALMCVATSQILYSWIMMPHTLPPTYIKFLNRHGGRQQWHYNAARVCPMLSAMCPHPLCFCTDAICSLRCHMTQQQSNPVWHSSSQYSKHLQLHTWTVPRLPCPTCWASVCCVGVPSGVCSHLALAWCVCEQELCERAGKPLPPTPYTSLQRTRFKTFQGTCPCEVLHPGQSCDTFMLNFFPGAYLRSVPLSASVQSCTTCNGW